MTNSDKALLEAIPRLQQELKVRFNDIRSIVKNYADDELHQQVDVWYRTSREASDVLGQVAVRLAEAFNAEIKAGNALGKVEMEKREQAYWLERRQQVDAKLNAILKDAVETRKHIVSESVKSLQIIEADRKKVEQDFIRLREQQEQVNRRQQQAEQQFQDAELEKAKADAFYKQAKKYEQEAAHIRKQAEVHFETGRKYLRSSESDAKRQQGITKEMNEILSHYREQLKGAEVYKTQQGILRNELQDKLKELDRKIQEYNAKDLELKRRGKYVTEKWREVQTAAKGAGVDVSKGIKV